ncbi:serine/arginine-rich splicing factor 10-like [Histomonas meleagridis]|uniref:serine/arginine-rich splicing factor 10-like n=1 Tax=Histomonas meleagridis TaxID=135588 RepID=UPI00355A2935|nr:serine/arginine-rich splicing factor 10-like [Histomonas meleagridis]KAH0802790.1 serine/arginine-rich splicing factor 10-like [Histomonas meleagridis]
MTFTLYVKPVSHISQFFIRDLFSQYGEVVDIHIPRDHKTKKRLNFAYIKYNDIHAAERAVKDLDEKVINNRKMEVQWATEKEKTPEEMIEKRKRYEAEREERLASLPPMTDEVRRKLLKRKKAEGPIYNRYFTAVDYPPGIGEEFTPIYQRGLPPVGQRRQFFSWVYVPPDQVLEILKNHKKRLEEVAK